MDNVEFKQYLKKKRETLSTSSINTYSSILRSLYKKVFGEGLIDVKKFENTKTIIKHLEDIPPNRRKTILSALVIITDKKEYRELMMNDIQRYKEEINKQEKTDAQEKNWVTSEEIGAKLKELQKIATPLMTKQTSLTNGELQQVQNYIILALLGGSMGILPRRAKDYVDFKIRNINTKEDNYMTEDGKQLVFNSYKTARAYGEQRIKLPTKLRNILRKWITLNPSDYLLIDSLNQPLGGPMKSANGSVKLNQRLEKIFNGKKAGVNMLRHAKLTEKFGHMIEQEKNIDRTMEQMGSSSNMLKNYVKKTTEND